MLRSTVIFLLLVTLLCCAPEGGRELSNADIEQIKTTMKAYRQAWMDNDSATVMNTLSNDIILFVPGANSPNVSGKAQLKDFWFPPSDTRYPIKTYEISDEEIFGNGVYATAQGKSLLIWDTVQGDSLMATDTSRSYYLTVLKKEDAHWRIYRQMYQVKN